MADAHAIAHALHVAGIAALLLALVLLLRRAYIGFDPDATHGGSPKDGTNDG